MILSRTLNSSGRAVRAPVSTNRVIARACIKATMLMPDNALNRVAKSNFVGRRDRIEGVTGCAVATCLDFDSDATLRGPPFQGRTSLRATDTDFGFCFCFFCAFRGQTIRFRNLRLPLYFVARISRADSATCAIKEPILGGEASRSGVMPNCSNTSVHTGPTEATTIFLKALRSESSALS